MMVLAQRVIVRGIRTEDGGRFTSTHPVHYIEIHNTCAMRNTQFYCHMYMHTVFCAICNTQFNCRRYIHTVMFRAVYTIYEQFCFVPFSYNMCYCCCTFICGALHLLLQQSLVHLSAMQVLCIHLQFIRCSRKTSSNQCSHLEQVEPRRSNSWPEIN